MVPVILGTTSPWRQCPCRACPGQDQNDTVMIGLDLDLTNLGLYHHTTVSGELQELSSLPIMYAYASDGTVVGWYLLNTGGMSTMVWSRDRPCLWGSKPQALSHESHLQTCILLYRFHRRRLQTWMHHLDKQHPLLPNQCAYSTSTKCI